MRDDRPHPWRETVRSLWFLPTVFILAALAAGYGLSAIEVADGGVLDSIVFGGDASAARELLIVVSGTMITVTGLVFVLTVVALQIASTQFSPRLLRTFLQDPGTRLVLGVFVATFAYSLGGLFTVGQTTDSGERFVPRLAVTGSLVLALISVGMLVYYIQHITNSIRIDTVMLGVRRATIRAIRNKYATSPGAGPPDPPPALAAGSLVVPSRRSGYLQEIDTRALVDAARRFHASVVLVRQVGHHVVEGAPLARITCDDPGSMDCTALSEAVNDAVTTAHERRVENDVGFGVRQLVDIAMRATAPSVNDPYTAVQAIQHLSMVMAALARSSTDPFHDVQPDGVEVFVPVPGFPLFLDLVCMNIRSSAADRSRVMVELFRMLETTALLLDSSHRRSEVARHVDLALEAAEAASQSKTDMDWVREAAASAAEAASTSQHLDDPPD